MVRRQSGTGSFKAASALTKISKALVVGESAGSVGSVTLEGAGPGTTFGLLTVGSSGKGTFNLTNGLASTTEVAILGRTQGSEGVMNVSGSASNFFINPNSGNFSIGQHGTAELNITAGGLVETSSSKMKVIVGEFARSQGTVYVGGLQSSLYLQSGQDPGQPSLIIGQGGTGTFNVTGGAKVNTGSFFLGYNNSGPAAAGTAHSHSMEPARSLTRSRQASIPLSLLVKRPGRFRLPTARSSPPGRADLAISPTGSAPRT